MKMNLLKSLDKNLPNILMVMGFGGLFVTTYFAIDGTFKAVEHIQEAKKIKKEETGSDKLEPKEVVSACAKDYVKTGIALAATAACYTSAYSEEARRATVATVCYRAALDTIADKERFQEKLESAVGPKKTKQLREEYDLEKAQQLSTNEAIEYSTTTPRTGDELVVIKDVTQGRVFMSTINNVKDAFISFKTEALDDISSDGFFVQDDFRDNFRKPWNDLNAEMGIDFSEIGHIMAFSFEELQRLTPRFTPDQTIDGKLCWALSYNPPLSFA